MINIANTINEKLHSGEKFFSLELSSIKTPNDEKIITEMNKMGMKPLFYAKTWHERSSNDKLSREHLLENLKNCPSNTLLHIVANDMKKEEIRNILDSALEQGKNNIFVLRGDHCSGNGDFLRAIDLVKFIKSNYGNKFVICVAGYPQAHPESTSRDIDIKHLKEKVDAGASFIITQMIFDSKVFGDFVTNCRKSGIKVPIIPGIYVIQSLESLLRMSKNCSVQIPPSILEDLERIKNRDECKSDDYGIDLSIQLIREIFEMKTSNGFHLFTQDRPSVVSKISKDVFV